MPRRLNRPSSHFRHQSTRSHCVAYPKIGSRRALPPSMRQMTGNRRGDNRAATRLAGGARFRHRCACVVRGSGPSPRHRRKRSFPSSRQRATRAGAVAPWRCCAQLGCPDRKPSHNQQKWCGRCYPYSRIQKDAGFWAHGPVRKQRFPGQAGQRMPEAAKECGRCAAIVSFGLVRNPAQQKRRIYGLWTTRQRGMALRAWMRFWQRKGKVLAATGGLCRGYAQGTWGKLAITSVPSTIRC